MLTVSGVAIAVATVVGVGSLLGAARRLIAVAMSDAGGGRTVTLFYRGSSEPGGRHARPNPLDLADSRAFRERLADRVELVSLRTQATVAVSTAATTASLRVLAIEPAYFEIVGKVAARGRELLDSDIASAAPHIVLSEYAARALFPNADALGQEVRIGATRMRVIGIAADGVLSGGRHLEAFVPVTTARFRIAGTDDESTAIYLRVRETAAPREVKAALATAVAARHRDHLPGEFDIYTADEFLARAENLLALVGALFGVVSLLCLFTGGAGIMNVLLSSVAERTREIGVRRAVGARRRDVFAQLLIESLSFTTLSAIAGAIVGYGVGALLCVIVNFILHSRANVPYSVTPSLSPWLLALAIFTSSAIGISFGVYPARVASRMDPAEALRIE
jgi:putative ABC transport system permease protein